MVKIGVFISEARKLLSQSLKHPPLEVPLSVLVPLLIPLERTRKFIVLRCKRNSARRGSSARAGMAWAGVFCWEFSKFRMNSASRSGLPH